jgi:hypothetical protein
VRGEQEQEREREQEQASDRFAVPELVQVRVLVPSLVPEPVFDPFAAWDLHAALEPVESHVVRSLAPGWEWTWEP